MLYNAAKFWGWHTCAGVRADVLEVACFHVGVYAGSDVRVEVVRVVLLATMT